jgi:hypothetical protein
MQINIHYFTLIPFGIFNSLVNDGVVEISVLRVNKITKGELFLSFRN